MINPNRVGGVAGGIENNANSVQLQLQLPTGTELGNIANLHLVEVCHTLVGGVVVIG